MRQQNTGIRRLFSATANSVAGLRAAWQHETAFRQECVLALLMTPTALWLGRSAVEYALLIGTVWLVLVAELLNSAIEAAIDRVGTDHHELSGRAKDLGSACVFMSILLTLIVWSLVAWERFAGASAATL